MNVFSTYVRSLMADRNLTMRQLAERSGLPESGFSAFLGGDALAELPPVRVIQGFAAAFGIPTSVLADKAIEACGLMSPGTRAAEAMSSLSNDDLLREVRRRLALGAAAGGYLSSRETSAKVLHFRAVAG